MDFLQSLELVNDDAPVLATITHVHPVTNAEMH